MVKNYITKELLELQKMQYLCATLPLWEFLVACRYTAWM